MLEQSLEQMNASGERYYQPELYRLQGKLLNFAGQAKEAVESFDKGIYLAKKQNSRVFEARLKTDLKNLLAQPPEIY